MVLPMDAERRRAAGMAPRAASAVAVCDKRHPASLHSDTA